MEMSNKSIRDGEKMKMVKLLNQNLYNGSLCVIFFVWT